MIKNARIPRNSDIQKPSMVSVMHKNVVKHFWHPENPLSADFHDILVKQKQTFQKRGCI